MIWQLCFVLVISLCLSGCQQVNENQFDHSAVTLSGQRIDGNWKYESSSFETLDGSYKTLFTFDNQPDNLFSNSIISINGQSIIFYANEMLQYHGVEYTVNEHSYQIDGDSLIYMAKTDTFGYVGDSPQTRSARYVFYSLPNNELGLETTLFLNGEPHYSKYVVRLSRYYANEIPPASWLSPIAADETEPLNNSAETATQVMLDDSSAFHTISYEDTDWFEFSGDSDKTYLITVDHRISIRLTAFELVENALRYAGSDWDDSYFIANGSTNVGTLFIWKPKMSHTLRFSLNGWKYSEGYYRIFISETDRQPPEYEKTKQFAAKRFQN
ncbi:MAG: hypothetical protein KDD94_08815 [Calditrichaeota bacterium]|nr:hypothetical protein [Calditrichota bacterium]